MRWLALSARWCGKRVNPQEKTVSLENAPDDVKLAVDLIMLLETHNIAPDTALSALEMVRQDFLRKQREAEKAE